jgi:RNA polymerase sigma-70 factor (ECF subfamily)
VSLDDEADLLARSQRGDQEAYGRLFALHANVAVRTAYVVTGNNEDAVEVVQEAFLKGQRAIGRFRAGAPFRPWILRIVANEAIDHRRRTGRDARLMTLSATQWVASPSAEELTIEREWRQELLSAVNRLSPRDRLLIAWRYWFELPESEMAQLLMCPVGTVKSRLSRALDRLERQLPTGRQAGRR